MKHWSNKLVKLGACKDAVEWAKTQPSAAAAWKSCERGDWMLWIACRTCGKQGSAAHRRVVLTACACARLTLKYIPVGEDRPRKAIETAEAWARRRKGVTLDNVRAAADDATDAADAANAYVYAAAISTYAAIYATYAAIIYASYAAHAAAYAAAAYDAERTDMLKQCAAIVRKYIPPPPEVRSKR